MEEAEIPTEKLQEEIHHHAEHSPERWLSWVALSTAFLAALAAVTSMLAGHHANQAMIDQVRASDQWAYYQAKGIKATVLESKVALLKELGHFPEELDRTDLARHGNEQADSSAKATSLEASSKEHLELHETLAIGVTMFQIAIAVAAISALVRKKPFWYVSLALGAVGVFFLIHGVWPSVPT